MRTRVATAADVAAVAEIEQRSFADPWSASSFASLVDDARVDFRVLEEGGRVVGYTVTWCIIDEGELANIAVSDEARRRGFGALLLDEALASARERGVQRVYLEVRESNAAAHALYASRGFSETGRRRRYYSHPVEDAIVMAGPAAG